MIETRNQMNLMDNKNGVTSVVFAAIDEINETSDPAEQISKNVHTILFGKDGVLDSIGLVNLIVTLEHKIETQLGRSVVLADEKAMSRKTSPFRTIALLIDYITESILETPDA